MCSFLANLAMSLLIYNKSIHAVQFASISNLIW